MNKMELIYGFVIGILVSAIGCFLFVTLFTDFDFIAGVQAMKSEGKLGKLITLGSVLDLIAFAALLKTNREIMARGVVLAVITIAILTLFI